MQYILKYKLINYIYAINYTKLESYTFEMFDLDDGVRPTKHAAGNIVCKYVLCGKWLVFNFKKHFILREQTTTRQRLFPFNYF
jgi:hypothetical protein